MTASRYPFIFSIFFVFCAHSLTAQMEERYSEVEMQRQDNFVKAKIIAITEDTDTALDAFKKLYDDDRNNATVSFELSKLFADKKDIANAIIYNTKAVENDSENKDFKESLALLYEQNFEFSKAADVYHDLLQHQPERRYYYEKLAFNQLSSGNPTQAIATLNVLEQKIGVHEESTRGKFEIYQSMGDEKMAEKELVTLSNAYPDETRYLHKLASFYQKQGKYDLQEELYSKILHIDPFDSVAKVNFSISQIDPSNTNSYLKSLKNVYENKSIGLKEKLKELIPFVDELDNNADTLTTSNLLELVNILEKTYPNQAPVYAIKGDIYSRTSNNSAAITYYKKTIEKDPSKYDVWTQLFYSQLEEKQYKDLTIYGEKALDVFPNQALNYFMIAKGYIMLGKPDDATDYITEGTFVSGKNQSIKDDFAILQAEQFMLKNDSSKAQSVLDKIMNNDSPKKAQQLEAIGDMYVKLKNIKKAKEIYLNAQKMGLKSPTFIQKIENLEK